ncbi:hypothetical protein ON010_g714 [Phytophthora cinnamomi]|nr:hypothetical protein ON010_g714 [Phytophthora cinnamomi]
MAAISWWDSRPVHFLCTGDSHALDHVARQDGATQVEVPMSHQRLPRLHGVRGRPRPVALTALLATARSPLQEVLQVA